MSNRHWFSLGFMMCLVVGLLSSCAGIATPSINIAQAQVERGSDLARGGGIGVEPMRVGIEVYYELSYTLLDNDIRPLVMVGGEEALWLDASGQKLMQGNVYTQQAITLIDVAPEGSIAQDIIYDGHWLIWQQFEPWTTEPAGIARVAQLWARDISHSDSTDILLDQGVHYSRDGVFYPFASFSMDEQRLAYRYAISEGSGRHTEVRVVDLLSPEQGSQSLYSVDESNGRLIQRCSVSGSRVVWDVRLATQEKSVGLPPIATSYYQIYLYELDSSKYTVRDNPLRQLTLNRDYHSPLLLGDKVFVTYQMPRPITGLGYGSAIGVIFPSTLYYSNYTGAHSYAKENIESMFEEGTARVIERSMPKAGRSLVTWNSSIAEQHIFFDTRISSLVELWPLGFEETATAQERYKYWEARSFTPVVGLDADYFLCETLEGDTELLRIGEPRVPTLADTIVE